MASKAGSRRLREAIGTMNSRSSAECGAPVMLTNLGWLFCVVVDRIDFELCADGFDRKSGAVFGHQ